MNRRAFLTLLSSTALAGCAGFNDFANRAYYDINVVAVKFEKAIAIARSNMSSAVALLMNDIVPVCKLFLAITRLAGQVSAASPQLANNKTFVLVLGQANTLAGNSAIQAAATSGVVPTDPVTILTGMIQLAGQIYSLTSGAASPTNAASA